MPILNVTPYEAGLSGVYPRFIYIVTTDTFATVITEGYLNKYDKLNPGALVNGDMALVVTNSYPTPATAETRLFQVVKVGQNWYLSPRNSLGSVAQVVETDSILQPSTASTTYVTSGISLSITPTAVNSRILLTANGVNGFGADNIGCSLAIFRNTTSLVPAGATALSYNVAPATGATSYAIPFSMTIIDSPATLSAVTYSIYFATTAGTSYIGAIGAGGAFVNATVIRAVEFLAS